jgi:hypothetical protein
MIFVHLGTHKTGTTSIQRCLAANSQLLKGQGYDLYHGTHLHGANHVEMHLSCLRPERDSFVKLRHPQADYGEAFRAATTQRIWDFLDSSSQPHQIFTNEGMSWLRFADEMERLRDLLQADRRAICFILYLREPKSFAASYRRQIYKVPGRAESKDPASVCYIEDDSWLLDYDAIQRTYRSAFPDATLKVIDYDAELSARGSVLPSFFAAIDTDPPANAHEYFLNKTR